MTAKESLKWAFNRLLHELPLNRISVMLLCEKAKVNRQTFYYYYQNIIDILKDVLFEEIYDEVARGRAYDTWKHGFLTTTRFIKNHHNIFLNIYYSIYWEEVNRFFSEKSNDLVRGVIDECITVMGVKIAPEDKSFMIHYYRVVFNGIMTEWVKDGMKLEPEILLFKLEKMIDGTIDTALRRFDQRQSAKP